MKASKIIGFLLCLAFVTTSVAASQEGPLAVSPASEMGIAKVNQLCPTFSWTAVDAAVGYRVEVFTAAHEMELSHDELASFSYPVLTKEIRGAALSWTPSSDQCLSNEEVYVWYVQAIDDSGAGVWSQGRSFRIEASLRFAPIEETLNETLGEHGVEKEIIVGIIDQVRAKTGVRTGGKTPVQISDGDPRASIQYGIELDWQTKLGYLAGQANSTNTGNGNAYFGAFAGNSNVTGDFNTMIGHHAGRFTTSSDNTFVGTAAGFNNTTGFGNTFFGRDAGVNNVGGYKNLFLGYFAGYNNTSGSNNTFVGYRAGYSNNAWLNTFLGYYAGQANTSGNENTFMGHQAGYNTSIGSANTFVGSTAGNNNVNGGFNIFLGRRAGYYETGSNKLYIDSSDTSSPLIWGDFGTDVVNINGKLGVGQTSPTWPVEVRTSGSNAVILCEYTGGAINYINAIPGYGNFGVVNNYPLRLVVNSLWRLRLDPDNSLTMRNGATCTAGGVWTDASSRDLKEDINDLSASQAMDALDKLKPVTYKYKADKEDEYVGFIAEEVPDLVASKDRKGMSPMDVVAVLTKVLQEQQRINEELRKEIAELKSQVRLNK